MSRVKSFIKQYIPGIEYLLSEYEYLRIEDVRKLPQDVAVNRVMDKYEKLVGYRMNINNPISFTEKLQWYKLFYDRQDLINVLDKYLFKQYIRQKLGEGYTIPLYGMWTSIKDLERDWNSLPEEFVLKSNLQSDGKFIEFIHKKNEVDFKSLKKELSKWLRPKNLLTNSFCRAYHNGKARIIAEQYLENVKNQLFDYKIFCFDGKPFCIYAAVEHFDKKNYPIVFYDLDWNKIDVQYGIHQTGDVPCPTHLSKMIKIAEKLSVGFPHVRVDFFDTGEHLYVAELTLFPGGGYSKYSPESFNIKMGELFNLPIINKEQWQEE
jgi:hypothetical protein